MTEQKTVQLVIVFLGATVLLCVGGGFWLANGSKSIPDFLVAIGSGAIGALSGILSKTSSDPAQVEVINDADQAVPVEETPAPAPKRARAAKGAVTLLEAAGIALIVIVLIVVLF